MKIKELLNDESKWTQGAYARDAQGRATTTFAQSATCFCLIGAAKACYGSTNHKYVNVLERLAEHLGLITGVECM